MSTLDMPRIVARTVRAAGKSAMRLLGATRTTHPGNAVTTDKLSHNV